MLVETIRSEQVWQSPDGHKRIWQVVVRADERNTAYSLKTFSSKIAVIGFKGDVESYVNKRGERFVRQTLRHKQSAEVNRDSNIRAQWAIGQAIALASATMDKQKISMPVIENYAKELFASVSRVKGEPVDSAMMQEAESYISSYAQPQRA